ncbi:MAG TPA: SDR family oxidoreductase [Thermoanaerobaculia bacterium]|jgi:NAD(P)-dependent dehydrogenase (short-subunit alcohol dehydrogenase family)|nr:SDR family oxidoreductase [Thermoanaerobaculia bacterium]
MAETRVALVTGGTRGIGAAIVRRLSADGFAVFLSGRTDESVRTALARFAKEGISVRGFAADARREEDQRRLVESAAREGGRLDVLVNNAGIGHFAPVDQMEPESFREVIETNLFGPFYAVRHAAPIMKKGGGGFIVHIASLAGVNAFAGGAAYNASKFGLLGFSEAAMLDLRHAGVRMATVLPGSVATDWNHSHGDQDASWMLAPEDVAEAVADLVRFPDRAIASRIDLRPSRPPKK